MSDFVEFLKREKDLTDAYLSEFLASKTEQARGLDGGFGKMMELISRQVLRGGKRARPMLVRLGYRLGDGDGDVVQASLFPELIHQNLLVHDDIADRDYKRYGDKTLEIIYGNWFRDRFGKANAHFGLTLAMLAGDHLRTLAHEALLESEFCDKSKCECLRLMSQVLIETLAGWQIQFWQNFEEIAIEQEERFLKGLELVTSKYSFEAPLMVGLILSGKVDKQEVWVKQYAHHVGIAFQLMDDILGVFGETEKTGKPSGNDIREGKKTLLILRSYKKAGEVEKRFLREVVGKQDLGDEELEEVRQIINETESLDYSQKIARGHVEKAIKTLDKIKVKDQETLKIMKQLAEFVVEREY